MHSEMQWERLSDADASADQRRAGHTATLVGSKVLVFGGRCGGHQFMNDLWEFDLEREKWKRLQEHAPFAGRAYHSATLVGTNKLWIVGGLCENEVYSDVHVLDTETLEWCAPVLQSKSKPRAYHAAVVLPPKCILLFGGCDSLKAGPSRWSCDLVAFNTDTLQMKNLQPEGPRPSPRGQHTFTRFGQKVLLFGGKNNNGSVHDNNLSVFDAFENKWFEIKPSGTGPCSRADHAAVLVQETSIIVHGGYDGNALFSDVYSLELSGNSLYKWRKLSARSTPARSAHSLVSYNDALYSFGGFNWKGAKLRDVYMIRGLRDLLASVGELSAASGDVAAAVATNAKDEAIRTPCSRMKRKLPEVQVTGKKRLVFEVESPSGDEPLEQNVEQHEEQAAEVKLELFRECALASSRRAILSALIKEEMEATAALEEETHELLNQLKTAERKLQEQKSSMQQARKSHENAILALEENYELQIHESKLKSDAERSFLLQEVMERKEAADQAMAELGESKESCRAMKEQNTSLMQQLSQKDEKLSHLSAELEQVKTSRDAAEADLQSLKTELESKKSFIATCKSLFSNV